MTRYDTNSKLLGKIQTGKGDEELYEGWKYIFIDAIFGGTKPENIKQEEDGINDIERARAARFTYVFDRSRMKGIQRSWGNEYERKFIEAVKVYSDKCEFV